MDTFLTEFLHNVMDLDSTMATHPILFDVSSPNEINELFDRITYLKGASILRMLEDTIGAETFRKAVSNYLNKFLYSNAETDDLSHEIQLLVENIDVK